MYLAGILSGNQVMQKLHNAQENCRIPEAKPQKPKKTEKKKRNNRKNLVWQGNMCEATILSET